MAPAASDRRCAKRYMKFLGLIPSAYFSGERRLHGAITKAWKMHTQYALVQGDWAYRDPVNVSPH
ncbi:MAG TPA: transposase [Alphaproteobacteria bacterium]|nr:transposase [Alphaproteobacteria bacterium]